MEPMAIERLVAEYLKLDGYFIKTRIPFHTRKGSISDLDVIGIKTKNRDSIVVECKAFGSANVYPNYDTPRRREDIRKYAEKLVKRTRVFLSSESNKKQFKISRFRRYLIIVPGYLDDDARTDLEIILKKKLRKRFRIMPIHELIQETIRRVEADKTQRGARYPDTALEMIRWMSRAFNEGRLGLTDIGLALRKKTQEIYPWLRKTYAQDVFRSVMKFDKGKHTRLVGLYALLSLQDKKCNNWFTRSQIMEKVKSLKLKRKPRWLGLGTWSDFGLIMRSGDTFRVNEAYRKELERLVRAYLIK